MNFPLVSVIIPVFNSEKTIQRAIDSVLNQTYPNIEIIIIDDWCTDNTLSVVKAIQVEHPDKIHLFLNQKNLGPGGSRNQGIALAKGEFLAFLDSDDTWMPNKLELQMPKFEDPDVGAVTCLWTRFDDPSKILGWNYSGNIFDKLIDHATSTFHTNSLVVRTEIMKKIGGFETKIKIGEDYLTWLKLADYTIFKCVPLPLFQLENMGTITKNLKLFMESDKIVRRTIFKTYNKRLTYYQKCNYNRIFHLSAGYYHKTLENYISSAAHFFAAWFYKPTEIDPLKSSLYSLFLRITSQ
jgi:glycosyltransferase involved in cell wall biosynthesis